MRGIPKHLNTKFDYEYIRQHFPPEQWKPRWQRLLDDRMIWRVKSKLEKEEDGKIDATSNVIRTQMPDESGNLKDSIAQMELVEDSHARLFKLGFTVKELQDALAAK